jgi:hypothetical protein
MKNNGRAEEVAQLLEEQASSGMSKKAFCEARGLAPSMFYYWQRRLSEAPAMAGQEPGFTQLEVRPGAELEVRLPGGQWLGVRASSAGALRLLLEAIGQRHA